jgi:hypothetical protein
MRRPRHRPSSGDIWDEGLVCPLSCLRWCSEDGEGIERMVASSPSPQQIGSLLYLCASRPDIMLSVCMCARFQYDPKECHLVAVKRILRYLVATPCFGIWYPKGSTFDLIG